MVLRLLVVGGSELTKIVVACQVRGEQLGREALYHVGELDGAVAGARGGYPANLPQVAAVRGERTLLDADPLKSRMAQLYVAIEALVLRDRAERRDDLLADLPRCRVEAHGHVRLVLALRNQHND